MAEGFAGVLALSIVRCERVPAPLKLFIAADDEAPTFGALRLLRPAAAATACVASSSTPASKRLTSTSNSAAAKATEGLGEAEAPPPPPEGLLACLEKRFALE